MAMSIRLFRTLCKYRLQPAEIATSMNNELALNNENGMFVTMFIGLLDLVSGRLDFCNAGHNPPVLNGDFIEMEPNAPLGLWENLDYEGEALENIKGKQFFVYSDGLNEAENSNQDQYSDDRLLSFLKGHTEMAAHPLIDLLMADVEQHVDGAGPSDDMTMLCFRMK
jgi:serine phosphatase RsbU (regulator of sigma subunit)